MGNAGDITMTAGALNNTVGGATPDEWNVISGNGAGVQLGTGSGNPPWHFEDENGALIGMDIEMGRILATALFEDPEKVEFVVQAADARIPNLLSDKIDITINELREERDAVKGLGLLPG